MIFWVVVIASAVWVYIDAKNIGVRKDLVSGFFNLGPVGWSLATLLLWIISFPCYLIQRPTLKAAAIAAAGNEPSSENTATSQSSATTESDAIGSLEKLADLRDRGILTGAEFEQKKQELLAT